MLWAAMYSVCQRISSSENEHVVRGNPSSSAKRRPPAWIVAPRSTPTPTSNPPASSSRSPHLLYCPCYLGIDIPHYMIRQPDVCCFAILSMRIYFHPIFPWWFDSIFVFSLSQLWPLCHLSEILEVFVFLYCLSLKVIENAHYLEKSGKLQFCCSGIRLHFR